MGVIGYGTLAVGSWLLPLIIAAVRLRALGYEPLAQKSFYNYECISVSYFYPFGVYYLYY